MRKVLLCQFSLDAGTVESEVSSRHIKRDSGRAQDTPWTALKQQQQQPWYCKNISQTATQSPDSSVPEEHN